MNLTQQNRWLLDAALFTGFLACFFIQLTGVSLHQWIGVIGGVAAAYHFISHRNWVSAVSRCFFGKTSHQARIFYAIDAVLLTGFLTMIITGLVISTWLDLAVPNYSAWHSLHVASSIGTLMTLVLKIGLHARWIVSVGKKLFRVPLAGSRASLPGNVGDQPTSNRRAFFQLMGVVGAASLLAFSRSIQSLVNSLEVEEKNSETFSTTGAGSFSGSSSPTGVENNSGICAVRCGRKCSYPGHCRRYTDRNDNGRCDLGECQS